MYGKRAVIVVYDPEKNLCLACARSDRKNAWQFPQGMLDDHESPSQAAVRELFEETGLISESNIAKLQSGKGKICVDVNCVADIEHAATNYEPILAPDHTKASVKFVQSVGPYFVHYPENIMRFEKGQEQFWFLAHKITPYVEISLNYEFSHYAWMCPQDVAAGIVDFKQDVYFEALKDLSLL